jgi:hypothetical protein
MFSIATVFNRLSYFLNEKSGRNCLLGPKMHTLLKICGLHNRRKDSQITKLVAMTFDYFTCYLFS